MEVGAADVINSLFDPGDIVNLRVFADRKPSAFTGEKLSVEAGKFSGIMDTLKKHNAAGRGIFFVVNSGGQDDASIRRINAQFVECDDLPFEEQQKMTDEFPLPPSMIVKTRRSLHTYWFIKDGDVKRFRPLQKALVSHFRGDPMCVNESRVMRLPGFDHCKEEPVRVVCTLFHPERRYTQDELAKCLGAGDETENESSAAADGHESGLELVTAGCDFIRHCRDDAASLPEHDWYAMITNLAPFEGGRAKIHELSASYPGYDPDETDEKIRHFLESGTKPITCSVIAEKGFSCPKSGTDRCPCRAPAALSLSPISVDTAQEMINALPMSGNMVKDLQTAQDFVRDFLFSSTPATAENIISHIVKDRFGFREADIRPLITEQKQLNRDYRKRKAAGSPDGEPMPPWYEVTDKGLRFMPDVLAEYLAKNVKMFYAAEQFYFYENGVYRAVSDLMAKNIVREKMLTGNTRLVQISDAAGQWKMQVQRDARELNSNPYLINVHNGIYSVLDGTLSEHTPDILSTVQLSVSYMPGAECPRFMQFLHESLDEDQIPLIQEMLGYFLIPVNRAQKSFVIVGEAGAGKSKLLLVLNDILLGRDNVSNVSWQALNERFKTAELFGKLANIFADLPTKNIDDNGIFKALVGEDYLTVERKNRDPFSFQPYARLLFSCNSIPKNFGDRSQGFYRRLIIIRFSHAVPAEKRDPDLLEKFRAEADGIFLFALEGLRRLMSSNFRFSETEANHMEVEKYREDSNSVLSFVKECCESADEYEVSRAELFMHYQTYCRDSGLTPFSQRSFNTELETNYPEVKRAADRTGRRKTWRGIRLCDAD